MNSLFHHDYLCYARADGDIWRAHCVDLDLTACARTLGAAQDLLRRAIARHVEVMDADDDDDAALGQAKPVVWTVQHPLC